MLLYSTNRSADHDAQSVLEKDKVLVLQLGDIALTIAAARQRTAAAATFRRYQLLSLIQIERICWDWDLAPLPRLFGRESEQRVQLEIRSFDRWCKRKG